MNSYALQYNFNEFFNEDIVADFNYNDTIGFITEDGYAVGRLIGVDDWTITLQTAVGIRKYQIGLISLTENITVFTGVANV